MMTLLADILAQTTPNGGAAPGGAAPGGGATPPPGGGASMLLFPALLAAMIVFMFLSARSQRKREQRQREEMFGKLGRNDRVLTVGGIIGTVIQVKDNEVVVKVDESNNTKMTFLKTAIQRIIEDEAALKAENK